MNTRINIIFINKKIKEKKQFTMKLQQTTEPNVTTYVKKYRVVEEQHLKKGACLYRKTADYFISALLDSLKTY